MGLMQKIDRLAGSIIGLLHISLVLLTDSFPILKWSSLHIFSPFFLQRSFFESMSKSSPDGCGRCNCWLYSTSTVPYDSRTNGYQGAGRAQAYSAIYSKHSWEIKKV